MEHLTSPTSKKWAVRILYALFILFILWDLSHSFRQYQGSSLDGDIVESSLPFPSIQKTYDDPFGIKTIRENDTHLGTNRFFSHYACYLTFRSVPFFLQNFMNPINSLYYTLILSKIGIQILLLLILTVIITGTFRVFSFRFIAVMALLLPFFQVNGPLSSKMGIIDQSVTYCFFYALPMFCLLLYYLPLLLHFLHGKPLRITWWKVLLWAALSLVCCFSGPLNAPVILLTNSIIFLYLFLKQWKTAHAGSFFPKIIDTVKQLPGKYYIYLIPIALLALYSLYLGTYIDAFPEHQKSLGELYALLPLGLRETFTSRAYLLLAGLLGINFILLILRFRKEKEVSVIFRLYGFVILFSIIYLLLLPFGGFRPYRPFLLRYDTVMPITLLCILTIGLSSQFLIRQFIHRGILHRLRWVYLLPLASVLFYLTRSDKLYAFNECEKASLYILQASKENPIILDNNCAVVNWAPMYHPDQGIPFGQMLYIWNVLDTPKIYYNRTPEELEKMAP